LTTAAGVSGFFRYPGHESVAASAFLAHLDEDEVEELLTYTQARRYRTGDYAVRQGARDTSLFIIAEGKFEVLVNGPQGAQKAGLLDPGDIFGELSFFDGEPRSADIRALVESETLVLTPTGFDRLRVNRPRLALMLTLDLGRVLSLRFRSHNRKLAALGRL
jgi:CRP/FNR family cyclic AMP-dependent transcriptional regulator